jgi:UDP-N-acetylglucosamine acyltransferase
MTKIHETAVIGKGAEIGEGAEIGPYCVISSNAKIGDGTRLMSHVVLDGCITIGRNCAVFPFACLGTQTQDLKYKGGKTCVEIGDRTTIREYVTINSATNADKVTKVGSNCHIMAYSHIAHECVVGNEIIMANCATLAGEVIVEDQAIIGGLSAVHQFTKIGRLCMIGGLARITQDCPPFMMIVGNPSEVHGVNTVGMERRNIDENARRLVKDAYKILYRRGLSTTQALEAIKAELQMCPELEHLIRFIESSERGIIK